MSVVSVDEVLKYVNEARTNPQKFAKYVEKELAEFFQDGRTLPLVPGCNYSTNEGKEAWVECKQFLAKQKPLEPYKLSKGLTLAAEDHAADMAAHNFQGHNGSDGSRPSDRINRRCEPVVAYGVSIASGENIGGDFMYEGRNYALNTVKSLIIDDGVSNRGHRSNIFSTNFHYIGIGSRVVGDKIRVVMNFHSHDPALKNSKPSSQAGMQLNPKKVPQQHSFDGMQGGFSKGGFGNFGNFGNLGNMGKFQGFSSGFGDDDELGNFGLNNFQVETISSSNNGGGRYKVSTQKSTKTRTVNGKTVKVTTQTIKYSDGSVETNQNTQTYG